jgi:hypothetical protein
VPDGVFTLAKGSDRADFHRLPKPDHADLETLAFNTEMRVTAWLRRREMGAERMSKDMRSDPAQPSPLRGVSECRLDRGLRERAVVVAEDALASEMTMRFQGCTKLGRERNLPLASALR